MDSNIYFIIIRRLAGTGRAHMTSCALAGFDPRAPSELGPRRTGIVWRDFGPSRGKPVVISIMKHSAIVWAAVIYDAAVAAFHALFWRLFDWPTRLAPAGGVKAAITQTLNLMLIYVFVGYATAIALEIAGTGETSPALLSIGAGFWLIRAAAQPALFRIDATVSTVLTVVWLLGATLHAWGALSD
jgi:hypothetical protein